jgi:RNA-directed DNA polymerase
MKWVKRSLNTKLKLVINEEKSKVMECSDKALSDFKHNIRRLTKPSWGISMQHRYRELRLYIKGWINYYGLSEYYRPLPRLDEWICRRIRMCYLKKWRRPRTRILNPIKFGTRTRTAVSLGLSSEGPY